MGGMFQTSRRGVNISGKASWWFIPLSKWVITYNLVISGLIAPTYPMKITRVTTHLRSVGWSTKYGHEATRPPIPGSRQTTDSVRGWEAVFWLRQTGHLKIELCVSHRRLGNCIPKVMNFWDFLFVGLSVFCSFQCIWDLLCCLWNCQNHQAPESFWITPCHTMSQDWRSQQLQSWDDEISAVPTWLVMDSSVHCMATDTEPLWWNGALHGCSMYCTQPTAWSPKKKRLPWHGPAPTSPMAALCRHGAQEFTLRPFSAGRLELSRPERLQNPCVAPNCWNACETVVLMWMF